MLAVNDLKRSHIAALFANGVCSEETFYLDGEDLSFSPGSLTVFARLLPAVALEIDFVVEATVSLDRFRAIFNDCVVLFQGMRLHSTNKLLKSDVVVVARG